jgi:hypothetical protein
VSLPGRRLAFGRLAGEFGLRQFDAIHTWALWAIDQLDAVSGTTPGATARWASASMNRRFRTFNIHQSGYGRTDYHAGLDIRPSG